MTRSPCLARGCSACCHDTQMPLTEADVARLEALGHRREEFTRPSTDGRGWPQLRTREADAEGAPRPCFFLRDGRCSVYEHRPEGCRVYPFVLTEDGKLARDEDCPHRDEFPHDPSARRRLARVVWTLDAEARGRA